MARRIALPALVLASLAIVAAAKPSSDNSPYFDLIGVGCVPWRPDGSSLAWRPEMPGIPASESMRIFKSFESPGIRRCLAQIVEADAALAADAHALGPKTAPSAFRSILSAIYRRWSEFGVGEALGEVAKSGKAGPKTEALLSRCEELERKSATVPGSHDAR